MPILSVTVVDVNAKTVALTGDDTVFIKYHSNAEATMDLKFGVMNLDTCVIDNGNERVYETSHVFYNVESNEFLFACSDADNLSFKKEVAVEMVDYVKLTCNMLSNNIDGDGNLRVSCYGNAFIGSFGVATNEIVAKCRYKEIAGAYSGWHDMDVSLLSNNSYQASVSLSGLDYEKQYSIQIMVNDELEEKTVTKSVKSKPLFHWGKDDFAFEIPVKANNVQVQEELRLKKDGKNYGTALKFGDGNYCYISEPSDDSLVIYAEHDIDLNTGDGNVYINGSLAGGSGESGEWTPELNYAAISDYYSCQGWYNRVGNTVTVGFIIKADCNSGYQNTTIEISGLPFTPSFSAAGGGMCSGAYISGGYNFQCFVAETDGTITTRVQQCNNTSATNLSTSASGCNYRNGGGSLTLSGTITYLTNE